MRLLTTLAVAAIVVLMAMMVSSGAEVDTETVISVSKYADRRGWIILE